MNYKRFDLDGETYFKYDNQWTDSTFIIVPIDIAKRLIEKEYGCIDFNNAQFPLLEQIINEAKTASCFDIALKATDVIIERAIAKDDRNTLTAFIPIKTSCLRSLSNSNEAIEFCKDLKTKYGTNILNIPALTSLAAAYCDIDDWESAKKTANYAYARQGGGKGYANELSLVFQRIKSNIK